MAVFHAIAHYCLLLHVHSLRTSSSILFCCCLVKYVLDIELVYWNDGNKFSLQVRVLMKVMIG